jgi:hypothetical protein
MRCVRPDEAQTREGLDAAWVRSRSSRPLGSLAFGLTLGAFLPALAASPYAWLDRTEPERSVERRIPPPAGFHRVPAAPGGFAEWLRGLPLKEGRPLVLLYDGQLKANQDAHFAVLDLDVGRRDLQQCADAVIRLRAEHLYSAGRLHDIHFRFTSGDRADFLRWAEGWRPVVRGSRVDWVRSGAAGSGYPSFRAYLDKVFEYAGSASLSRELRPVPRGGPIEPGDVFIQGGFPGHAVIVLDVAVQQDAGRRCFLLAQSFMPAQQMHVLRNPEEPVLDPWYADAFGPTLRTPEWTFQDSDLRRFD